MKGVLLDNITVTDNSHDLRILLNMSEQTITLNALSLAFLAVKENHGCAGADGVTVDHYEGNLDLNLKILLRELEI